MRRVALDGENHQTGQETDFGIGLGSGIDEELVQWLESIGFGLGLSRSEAAQGY
jgi:hypothetical protein